MLMLAGRDGMLVRAPRLIEPVITERYRFIGAGHEDIAIGAADQVAKEIADHPVVPEMIALVIRPSLQEFQRQPLQQERLQRQILLALPLLHHPRQCGNGHLRRTHASCCDTIQG